MLLARMNQSETAGDLCPSQQAPRPLQSTQNEVLKKERILGEEGWWPKRGEVYYKKSCFLKERPAYPSKGTFPLTKS